MRKPTIKFSSFDSTDLSDGLAFADITVDGIKIGELDRESGCDYDGCTWRVTGYGVRLELDVDNAGASVDCVGRYQEQIMKSTDAKRMMREFVAEQVQPLINAAHAIRKAV